MPEFRPKKILPKVKEWILKRIPSDPGNPYLKQKQKPVIELKSFSVVMDQKMFAGRVVLKRLRTNPYHNNKFRVSGQTKEGTKKLIELAESTKPTKTYAKFIRAIYKPTASILDTLTKSTGLPSIEKKAIRAKELTTPAGSSRRAIEKVGGAINKTKQTRGLIDKAAKNPGRAVTKAAEITVRNPEITIGGVAGKGIMLVPGVPMSVKMAPIGNASLAVAASRKTFFPKVTNTLEKTADAIHNSPRRPSIERGINKLINTGSNIIKATIA